MRKDKKPVNLFLVWLIVLIVILMNSSLSSGEPLDKSQEKVIIRETEIIEKYSKNNEINLIIRLKDDTKKEEILSQLPIKEYTFIGDLVNGFVVKTTKKGFNILKDNPNIKKISPSMEVHAVRSESIHLIDADVAIKRKINDIELEGEGQTICVIDTGVDYTHPELDSCTEAQFLAGTCNKVIAGYDFCGDTGSCGTDDNNPKDNNGHGSHVAGIAAGTDDGVAPEVKIVAIKVLNASGRGAVEDIGFGIKWCTDNSSKFNISVISISIGNGLEYGPNGANGTCPTDIDDEINNATSSGISVFIASGNEGYENGMNYPGCSPNAISVGAVYDDNVGRKYWCFERNIFGNCIRDCEDAKTKEDKVVCFSNVDTSLDLLAPGSEIRSTVPLKSSCPASGNMCDNSRYHKDEGTSMATPHVAGAAALLYQLEKLKGNTISPSQIESVLKSTGEKIKDERVGKKFRRINVEAALLSLGLIQTKNITVFNTGDDYLDIDSITFTSGENWMSANPKKLTVPPSDSDQIEMTTNTKGLTPSHYTTNIYLNSNDPDEDPKIIPALLSFYGQMTLLDKVKGSINLGKFWWAVLHIKSGSLSETDNLKLTLDWPTDDELDFILQAPNGTNYTKNSPEINFTDGHPKIITVSTPVLYNGTWLITINSTQIADDEVEFSLATTPFPSDLPTPGVDFTNVRMNYISTCSDTDNPGLRILMNGKKAAAGEPIINATNATKVSHDAFLTGLVIPNHKQRAALKKDEVEIDPIFAQTQAAQLLLSADVKLKTADKTEWVKVVNASYNYWDSLLSSEPYYSKITSQTNWYYPQFTGSRFIRGTIQLNGSDCDVYANSINLSVTNNITLAYMDYSGLVLTPDEINSIDAKLPAFLSYINNKTQNTSVPVLNDAVNNNQSFADLRRIFTSLALAQWYKTQDRENLLFGDLIDTENITAVNVNITYDKDYWNNQGYQKLYTATLNLPSGNFTQDWYGGLVFSEINLVIKIKVLVPMYKNENNYHFGGGNHEF